MRIIGESSGVIAVWKPAGLATQAPPGVESAESWLRRRLHGAAPRGYLGVPHRLDRAVSGVVLFAATPRAARKLSRQFERRQVLKAYRAIVACGPDSGPHVAALELAASEIASRGTPAADAGSGAGAVRWEDLVLKIPDQARTRLAAVGEPQAREAVTLARLVRRPSAEWLLLELEPVTGRMHQLRLQAAARGMPMLGDDVYGAADQAWVVPSQAAGVADPRTAPIALHAARITYADPDTGAAVTIEAPLPDSWPLTAR